MLSRTTDNQLPRFLAGFFLQALPGALVAPLLALRLASTGVGAAAIGALATLAAVTYMAALAVMPALLRRLGDRGALRLSLVASAAALAGLVLTPWPGLWALLYALLGFASGVRFTVAESWVPALAPPGSRGRVVALFQTAVGAAAFAGSGALLLTGVHGPLPTVIVVSAALIGLVVLWGVRPPARRHEGEPGGAAPAPLLASGDRAAVGMRAAAAMVGPAVLAAAALGGIFESGLWVALPLYGLAFGISPELAAATVTAMGLGSLAQYPFGALADRFPWRRVVLGSAALIAASALLLPLAPSWPPILLGLGFVWGSAGGGLYTLATIRNSTTLRGGRLIGASVVTQLAYMVGEAGGPTVGGLAIDLAPRYGLPALVAAVGLAGLLVLLGVSRPRPVLAPAAGEPA